MTAAQIVAGYDGSLEARTAVDWAAAEAARTSAPLLIVYAYQFAWPSSPSVAGPGPIAVEAGERAEHIIDEVVEHVRKGWPGLAVTGTSVHAAPASALLDLAGHARLLVVGNRGAGGVANLLLGSVSQQVATHARVPVAVIRGQATATRGPVVVGVDGSPSTDAALALAFDLAATRGTGLVAIRAFTPPSPVLVPLQTVEAAEHEALDAALTGWPEKYPGVALHARPVPGRPARVLIGASHAAQLIVVGSRGHGGFAGLLLGSVGQQLMHHADCPVLIAHRPDPGTA
ncbi:universal stress protein [Dactylosporangium sp. CA-092794]|uniref:universal stress protein n=1 Tax=Dactylosporangium sp. CA-092794 TaxID=3239929 RepID=UPI003D8B4928